MKKYFYSLLLLFTILCFSPISSVLADDKTPTLKEKNHPASPSSITLYEKPDLKSSIVTQLSLNNRVIPFYQQKDWVKVGLPENGVVGWINIPTYVQARENFYRSKLQTIYLQINDKPNGKKQIIAYKNGEKLNDTEATKLYQQLRQQNQQQIHQFQLNNNILFDEIHQNFNNMRLLEENW